MKKSICMIIQNPLVKGGIAAVINGYRCSRLEKDFDITYVESYKDGGKLGKFLKAIGGYIQFIKILFLNKPDLIHIHSSFGPSFYRKIPFIYLAYWLKKPVVNHIHGSDIDSFYNHASDRKKRLVEKTYQKCSVIVALSEEWKDQISRIVPAVKIVIIENFSIVQGKALQDRLNRQSHKTVLFMGEIGERKGCFDIPSVVERVAKVIPDVRFVIGGSGEIDKVKKLLVDKKIQKNVEFPGWVRDEEKDKLLREADVFFLPSYNEGMPMSILEAMGYGLPVVSTVVGGISKIVRDGENGYLFQAGDIEGFSEAIIKILLDAALSEMLGKHSCHIAKTEYSLEAHLVKIEDLYSHILRSSS